jgi:hypothetical protein
MKKLTVIDPVKLKSLSFYIIIAGVLLAEVVAGLVIIPDKLTRISADWQEADQVAAESGRLTNLLTTIATVDQASLEADLAKVTAALPDEKKTTGLVSGLSILAPDYGVLVRSLEFSPGLVSTESAKYVPRKLQVTSEIVTGNGVKAIPAALSVATNFHSLISFLTRLTTVSQIITVTSVELSAPAGKENLAVLSLMVYYQPRKEGSISWRQVDALNPAERAIVDSLEDKDLFTLQSGSR